MGASPRMREKLYRAYMEFFDVAERKRRWHPVNDIPWEKFDTGADDEIQAVCAETFCGVELYVPDYTAHGLVLNRQHFGHAWFQASWGYEESKHAIVFREFLVRSGLRTEAQYEAFETAIYDRVWEPPFSTRRELLCYGTLQEAATYLIYKAQKERAERRQDRVLEKVYFFTSRDEAAHLGFYRTVLAFELEEDREGTLEDLAQVVFNFRMPGVGLIPDYDTRLLTEGVAITAQQFLEHGIFPTLRSLGATRSELTRAYRQRAARRVDMPLDAPADTDPHGDPASAPHTLVAAIA